MADLVMNIALVVAYFLPILFLAAFVGRAGKKYLVYLLWGFLASAPVLFLVNNNPGSVFTQFIPPGMVPQTYLDINIFPLLEEFFKALPIIIPALIGIKNRDEDLLVCAMASGIGFSIIENLKDGNPGLLSFTLAHVWNAGVVFFSTVHTPADILNVLILSFSLTLMHGCTTAIIGYGIVLIRNFDRHALPTLLFGFYTIAVTIHAMFNLLLDQYGEYGAIVDFIFPVFLFFVLHACYHVDIPVMFRKDAAEQVPCHEPRG
jgi:RsiW-degrading membrane proteinase PrsW (M82 family)